MLVVTNLQIIVRNCIQLDNKHELTFKLFQTTSKQKLRTNIELSIVKYYSAL